MKTGIFFAAKPEAAAVLSCGFFGWKKDKNGFYKSEKTDTLLCISGVGKDKAIPATELLAQNCDKIFILGTCAALTPQLPVFTFCLPTLVLSDTADDSFVPDNELTARLADVLHNLNIDYKTDLKLVSTNNLIATKEQAESLHYKTDAVIGDMESVAVMQTLAKTKTPAAILRAVSDNPAAGVLPLDTNSGTFANKWIENTAEISKHFPAVLKILVS